MLYVQPMKAAQPSPYEIAPELDWLDQAHLRLERALERTSSPAEESDPSDIATRALLATTATKPSLQRVQQEHLIFETPGTKTSRALQDIINAQENASHKLSTLGYQNVRHLRSRGLLMVEIARDLDINVNDLMAYMRLHPNSHEDALQDEETCADARTMQLDEWIESYSVMSKFDSEKLKLRTQIQLEMNKRLSAKWALRTDKDLLASQQASHLSVVIGNGNANEKPRTIGGKPYNENEHGPNVKADSGKFQMVIRSGGQDGTHVAEIDDVST